MENIFVRTIHNENLLEFLNDHGYTMKEIEFGIYQVLKDEEIPVFMTISSNNMFFQVDLGNISEIADENLYFKLLDLNTEILPVSVGIDTTNEDDPRLVVCESREVDNLDSNEFLYVFNALQIAADKVEFLLAEYLN